MAKDIQPLDPWKDKCPWCDKPILVQHQLAIYEGGDSEQFVGLERDDNGETDPDEGLELRPEIVQRLLRPRSASLIPIDEMRRRLGIIEDEDGSK